MTQKVYFLMRRTPIMNSKTISEISKELWETNISKGWDKVDYRPLEVHALITSEIAEATEAVRNGEEDCWSDENGKAQGEAVELADAVIRIMNYFTQNGWDLEAVIEFKDKYNKTRPKLHGGKLK
jgi:NTP pyrophosphatase (non-canonical NTP hydrolase)